MSSSESPTTNWKEIYKAALFEDDNGKIPQRIAEAERALVARAHELFQTAGGQAQEQEAIENAMYFLRVLGSTVPMHSSNGGRKSNQANATAAVV